jgi:hypothetical protein
MVVISSRMTKFYKYVFPTFWFGFLAIFLVVALTTGEVKKTPLLALAPCGMAAFGYFLFRKLIWALADEVRDGGNFLVFRKGSEEITVYLANIMNVSASTNTSPPQVTLKLVEPTKFGGELIFSPVQKGFSLNPFRKNEVVEDLIVRVDKARRSSGR